MLVAGPSRVRRREAVAAVNCKLRIISERRRVAICRAGVSLARARRRRRRSPHKSFMIKFLRSTSRGGVPCRAGPVSVGGPDGGAGGPC